jgi:hypothetical protein
MNTLELIRQERNRQIKKGFDSQHDDQEVNEELARAAAVYVMPERYRNIEISSLPVDERNLTRVFWPYREEFKMSSNRRKDLIKAAALIVAEIERINRIKNKK